jgi:hypothetical protein
VQRILVKSGMAGVRAETLANQTVRLVFLVVFAVLTLYLLRRVRDYRTMIVSTAAISLVWFLMSFYILPWYLAAGLMVASVAGWNATTGAYITVASVFTLYHIPATNIPVLTWSGRFGTNLFLSLPFFLVLAAWLFLVLRDAPKRRKPKSIGTSGAGAADE